MPIRVVDVANKLNACTRSARNHFSNHVERVLGLANDLKCRIGRINMGDNKQDLTIKFSNHTEQTYDEITAGKTSWRLSKWIRKLWTLMKCMTEGKYETAYTTVQEDEQNGIDEIPGLADNSDSEEEDSEDFPLEWGHLTHRHTDDNGKVTQGNTTCERLQTLATSIKKKARSIASKMRREIRDVTEERINAPTQDSDKRNVRVYKKGLGSSGFGHV